MQHIYLQLTLFLKKIWDALLIEKQGLLIITKGQEFLVGQ